MQRPASGAHADCVTARADSGPATDATARVLARACVDAVQAVGGFAGGIYLRSGPEGPLLLAVLMGLPGKLFRPWWRMHVNRPYPVAEAYRSGQSVHLPDADTAMQRFPQMMAGLPFPFGSLYEPVMAGAERFGVLFVLRPATPVPRSTPPTGSGCAPPRTGWPTGSPHSPRPGNRCSGRAIRCAYRRRTRRRVRARRWSGSRCRCSPWTARAGSATSTTPQHVCWAWIRRSCAGGWCGRRCPGSGSPRTRTTSAGCSCPASRCASLPGAAGSRTGTG